MGAFGWPRFRVSNLKDWVRSQVQGQHDTLFVAALWGLWRWRNNTVLGENDWNVDIALRWIRQEAFDYDKFLASGLRSLSDGASPTLWKASTLGVCKLNTDGAFSSDRHRM